MNLVFIFDVGLQFELHYQDAQGTWIRNHRRIIKHYLQWVVPLDFVLHPVWGIDARLPGGGQRPGFTIVAIITPKVLRNYPLLKIGQQIPERTCPCRMAVRLVGFVLLRCSFAWMACVWGFTGTSKCRQ